LLPPSRASFLVFALLAWGCWSALSAKAQEIPVYPVGDPNTRPAPCSAVAVGPEEYCISRAFRELDHTGVDLATVPPRSGGTVRSVFRGLVILSVPSTDSAGFGNVILIEHALPDRTFYSLYAHLEDGSVPPLGAFVETGTPVGRVGITGNSGGVPHLHFAIKTTAILGCGYINSNCKSERISGLDSYSEPLEFIAQRRVVSIPMLSGGIQGVAVEAGGRTALVAERSGELSRVDLATGQVTTIAFVNAGGIASSGIELNMTIWGGSCGITPSFRLPPP